MINHVTSHIYISGGGGNSVVLPASGPRDLLLMGRLVVRGILSFFFSHTHIHAQIFLPSHVHTRSYYYCRLISSLLPQIILFVMLTCSFPFTEEELLAKTGMVLNVPESVSDGMFLLLSRSLLFLSPSLTRTLTHTRMHTFILFIGTTSRSLPFSQNVTPLLSPLSLLFPLSLSSLSSLSPLSPLSPLSSFC